MALTHRENNAKDYKTVKAILDKYKIKFFVIQATCLGAMKHSNFLEWDNDVDIAGFMTKEQEVQIREDLRKEGFKVEDDYCVELPQGCTKVEGYIRSIRNTLVDLYRLLEDEKGYFINPIGKLYFKKETLETLKEAKLGEQRCFVPNPPDDHLVGLYGEDWKEPYTPTVKKRIYYKI